MDLRKGPAQSGLFERNDPHLPADTLAIIRNEIPDDSFVLEVDEP